MRPQEAGLGISQQMESDGEGLRNKMSRKVLGRAGGRAGFSPDGAGEVGITLPPSEHPTLEAKALSLRPGAHPGGPREAQRSRSQPCQPHTPPRWMQVGVNWQCCRAQTPRAQTPSWLHCSLFSWSLRAGFHLGAGPSAPTVLCHDPGRETTAITDGTGFLPLPGCCWPQGSSL